MSLRAEVQAAVESGMQGNFEAVENMVSQEPRSIRYLLGMTYHFDEERRRTAGKAIAIASQYHPKLVKAVVRRLIWAMNDESGTNALTAPDVLIEIARVRPEILLPAVPDLTRLATDEGLHDGLASALKLVSKACPGEVGSSLSASLNKRLRRRRR